MSDGTVPETVIDLFATCHTIGLVRVNGAVKLVGDPIELRLLEATGWHLKHANSTGDVVVESCPLDALLSGDDVDEGTARSEDTPLLQHTNIDGATDRLIVRHKQAPRRENTVVHTFPFSSTLARMGVVAVCNSHTIAATTWAFFKVPRAYHFAYGFSIRILAIVLRSPCNTYLALCDA